MTPAEAPDAPWIGDGGTDDIEAWRRRFSAAEEADPDWKSMPDPLGHKWTGAGGGECDRCGTAKQKVTTGRCAGERLENAVGADRVKALGDALSHTT